MIGLIFMDSHTGSDKFLIFSNISNFYVWNLKENEIRQKQVFADIVYFDLIYHSEKKRENSNRGQKMSTKVCQRFLYSLRTLVVPLPRQQIIYPFNDTNRIKLWAFVLACFFSKNSTKVFAIFHTVHPLKSWRAKNTGSRKQITYHTKVIFGET